MRKRSISILDRKNSTFPILHAFLFFSFLIFANEREKLIISQGVDDGFDAKMWNWKGMEIVNLSYIIRVIIDEKKIDFDIGWEEVRLERNFDRKISWRTGEVILLVPLLRIFPPRIYLLTGEQMRNFPQILTETRLEGIDVRNFLEKYRKNIPIFRKNKLPSGSNYSALKKIDQTLPLTCLN